MIPIRYKDGTPTTVSTLSVFQLGDLTDTPIDSVIEGQGGWIEFPIPLVDFAGRRMDKVWMPPFGSIKEGTLILLSFIQSSAQMLLTAIESFKAGDIDQAKLNRFLGHYQSVALGMIFGRKGFISQHIMCNRMSRSGRAVLLPMRGGSPFECKVPSWMMKALKIRSGELAVVGRDPTIWDGGIECLIVRGTNEDVIRLHPLVFEQLAADCDGDQVWIMAIPEELQSEMRPKVGSFMRTHAVWPKPWNREGEKVDWDDAEQILLDRSRPDGFSVGPEDIMSQNAILAEAEDILGKELAEDCLATAQGLTLEQWRSTMLDVNADMLKMKVGMGPVGAAAMNLRVLAGHGALLKKSACEMSERVEQLLLSAKNKGAKERAAYCAEDILDLLNRRNDFVETSEDDAIITAATMLGLKPSRVRPMIKRIWKENMGLSQIIRSQFPLFAATTQAAENIEVSAPLALRLFRDKKTDSTGVCRFIIDGLAELAHRRDEIEERDSARHELMIELTGEGEHAIQSPA